MQYALPNAALAMQYQSFPSSFFFVSLSCLLSKLMCEPRNGQYTEPAITDKSKV